MVYLIVNDLPGEFGEVEILSAHSDSAGAEAEMTRLKGVLRDSYRHQYVRKIGLRKINLEDVFEVGPNSTKRGKQNDNPEETVPVRHRTRHSSRKAVGAKQ